MEVAAEVVAAAVAATFPATAAAGVVRGAAAAAAAARCRRYGRESHNGARYGRIPGVAAVAHPAATRFAVMAEVAVAAVVVPFATIAATADHGGEVPAVVPAAHPAATTIAAESINWVGVVRSEMPSLTG